MAGEWYDDHGLMFTDSSYMCRGSRAATRGDFQSSQGVTDGGFYWENEGDELITGPIEVRLMTGQASFSEETEDGPTTPNEDIGLAFADIEVYGCVIQEDAECGNGVVDFGEDCDDGPDGNDNGETGSWGNACSRACTKWNPDTELGADGNPCNIYGHSPDQDCAVTPPECATENPLPAETVVTPAVQEVLPAWVSVMDYSQGFKLEEPCPGNLKKVLHNIYGDVICAPPYLTSYPPTAEGCDDAFYKIAVAPPATEAGEKLCYSGVKGHIVSSGKGSLMRHFLKGNAVFEGDDVDNNYNHDYRKGAGGDITLESNYVDGISVTHGAPGARSHIFPLAHGIANGYPPTSEENYEVCLSPARTGKPVASMGCFIGNCNCHGGDEVYEKSEKFSTDLDPSAPDFVGDDFYCDGGTNEAESYVWGNAWSNHKINTGGNICVGTSGVKPAGWWSEQGLTPGEFSKYLGKATDDDLEIRILTPPGEYMHAPPSGGRGLTGENDTQTPTTVTSGSRPST